MPNLTKDEVLRLLGATPEVIAQELSSFADAASVLSSDHPRLIDEHPDQWVGIYRGEVAATATELPTLMVQLTARGIPPENTIVRFIDREEKTLLLL